MTELIGDVMLGGLIVVTTLGFPDRVIDRGHEPNGGCMEEGGFVIGR